jgi:hypothetical protein
MTSKFHLLNLSIGFMLVAAFESAFVGLAPGGRGFRRGTIDLGTPGQEREMKTQSRKTLVIGKEYL